MKPQVTWTEKTPGDKTIQVGALAAWPVYAAAHGHAQAIVLTGADAGTTRR